MRGSCNPGVSDGSRLAVCQTLSSALLRVARVLRVCVKEGKRSTLLVVGRGTYAWSFNIVEYAHLRVVRVTPTCDGVAGSAPSLGRLLPRTFLRSNHSTASRFPSGSWLRLGTVDERGGAPASRVSQASFVLVWPRVIQQKCALGLQLHNLITARFVLHTTPTYTYFCHRRANLLDPTLAHITSPPCMLIGG